jgi:N-acetylglucosaminyldiphosphoundecaprenol N-acetyl-beta-D-mannosaminyltransferase
MILLEDFKYYDSVLHAIPDEKVLILTINAYSYNISRHDQEFSKALKSCDILLPDGISIVWAMKWLYRKTLTKIAGEDLFYHEMSRLQNTGGSCFFLGSSNHVLHKIRRRVKHDYPNVKCEVYSPPYKTEFDEVDNREIIKAVNLFSPDVLFIGMTAPKQEKWAFKYFEELNSRHICCIGAVFDFYAGTVKRAPRWMINLGLEWFYRLMAEPRRLWRRYLLGNIIFLYHVLKERCNSPLF